MMDPIRALMTLAGSEAAAAGYAEITPAHLLIALSRASESDLESQFDTALLQGEFAQLGIEPRRFRRRLRALVGKGGQPPPDGPLHRSAACKTVFAWAHALATEEGKSPGLEHLLRAAFALLAWGGPRGEARGPRVTCPMCGLEVQALVVDGRRQCPACGASFETTPAAPRPPTDDIPVEL
jgi:hypothetical protein